MSFSRFHPLVQQWFLTSARRADAGAGARLDLDRRRPAHADRRAHRIGQDARGVSVGHRRADARGPGVAAAGRSPRDLRLAAEGAERRHSQEPGGAAARDSPAGRGGRPAGAADHGRRPHRRHLDGRARGDAADAAAHPGHDAGVAVPAADLGAQPADAAHRPHRHRRRDPRGDRHAARRAPGAVARTAPAGRGAAAAADRAVGHAEADRRGGAFPRPAAPTARSWTRGIAARWISRSRSRDRRSTR